MSETCPTSACIAGDRGGRSPREVQGPSFRSGVTGEDKAARANDRESLMFGYLLNLGAARADAEDLIQVILVP
jgi:hypothetical protein